MGLAKTLRHSRSCFTHVEIGLNESIHTGILSGCWFDFISTGITENGGVQAASEAGVTLVGASTDPFNCAISIISISMQPKCSQKFPAVSLLAVTTIE